MFFIFFKNMEKVIKVDDCIDDYDIHNASIVSKNTTNGDMIKAMFPNAEIKEIRGSFDKDKLLGYRTWLGGRSQDYLLDWWNAPYSIMEWNYNLNEAPIDTPIQLLSANDCILLPQKIFIGTITYNHKGELTRGECLVGEPDYFYRSEIVAWRYDKQ